MEPFGLFDFLSSLLSSPSQNADSSPSATALPDASPSPVLSPTALPDALPPETQTASTQKENALPAEIDSAMQNAFLQFLEAHDERAKRTRRR